MTLALVDFPTGSLTDQDLPDSQWVLIKLMRRQSQSGFTLIELMIALLLGVLISAAALQIFYTSIINLHRQEAGSQIVDKAIFGLTDLEQHLRRTNFGAHSNGDRDGFFMNHLTPQGGVVLTAPSGTGSSSDRSADSNSMVDWSGSNLHGLKLNNAAISKDLLSANASAQSASNLADIPQSDQLTIQYQSGSAGKFDCQGRSIPKGYFVIERYFVRKDTSISPSQNGLACAAAIYQYDQSLAESSEGIDLKSYLLPGITRAKPNKLAGKGSIVIAHVDYFRVLLGISSSEDFAAQPNAATIGYMSIPTDQAVTLNNRRIVSAQIGLLTHSDSRTATPVSNSDLRFDILDKSDQSLDEVAVSGPTYLYYIYESTVLFRNARGGLS